MDNKSYTAVVQKTIVDGKHGPYAVVELEKIGSVTFSLQAPVWNDDRWPEEGDVVVLTRVRKKRAGWRAESGRFYEPSDEQQSSQPKVGRRKEQ